MIHDTDLHLYLLRPIIWQNNKILPPLLQRSLIKIIMIKRLWKPAKSDSTAGSFKEWLWWTWSSHALYYQSRKRPQTLPIAAGPTLQSRTPWTRYKLRRSYLGALWGWMTPAKRVVACCGVLRRVAAKAFRESTKAYTMTIWGPPCSGSSFRS